MTGNTSTLPGVQAGLNEAVVDRSRSVAQRSIVEKVKAIFNRIGDTSAAGGLYNPRNREIARSLAF